MMVSFMRWLWYSELASRSSVLNGHVLSGKDFDYQRTGYSSSLIQLQGKRQRQTSHYTLTPITHTSTFLTMLLSQHRWLTLCCLFGQALVLWRRYPLHDAADEALLYATGALCTSSFRGCLISAAFFSS